ncbi:hypothetical protein O6H91_09G044000 [Diphasiastrum complanatum]|uniref:Uncharacterized protein n=1 Tax=Diphasiastrum complanatum TaxID=34168 RepID=A0ACC2CNW0_DIPCM|nr:hypothetical protein O6H91_09G044000 [Diphasiastrum complanatum]
MSDTKRSKSCNHFTILTIFWTKKSAQNRQMANSYVTMPQSPTDQGSVDYSATTSQNSKTKIWLQIEEIEVHLRFRPHHHSSLSKFIVHQKSSSSCKARESRASSIINHTQDSYANMPTKFLQLPATCGSQLLLSRAYFKLKAKEGIQTKETTVDHT